MFSLILQEALLNPVANAAAETVASNGQQSVAADSASGSTAQKAPSDKTSHTFAANMAHVKLKRDVYGLNERQLYIWADQLTRSEWLDFDVPPPGIGIEFSCIMSFC